MNELEGEVLVHYRVRRLDGHQRPMAFNPHICGHCHQTWPCPGSEAERSSSPRWRASWVFKWWGRG